MADSLTLKRSCVSCHTLPDGSSNTATELAFIPGTVGNLDQIHPIETAAMRNLFQREMLLHRDFKIPTLPFVQNGNIGFLHTGDPLVGFVKSINDFVGNVFLPVMPGPDKVRQVESLIEFIRRMDSGIAPAIGLAYTFIPGHPSNLPLLRFFEEQVEQANIGLAVYTRVNNVEKGYYYDLTTSPPLYREEGTTNTLRGAAFDELASSGDGLVILQATPVGSERRVANLNGVATVVRAMNDSPAEITLEPMAPPTQWVEVTQLTDNLDPTPDAISLQSMRALQDSVIGDRFGVPGLRHEPPRRFRVSGNNIRHGATLFLSMSTTDTPKSFPVQLIRMPLFPTKFTSDGRQIWETTAEADAMVTMALLNGGLWAPGVAGVMTGDLSSSELLDPDKWNFFIAGVVNEDNTINLPPVWQKLTVQDGR